jgi:hypothetical protein
MLIPHFSHLYPAMSHALASCDACAGTLCTGRGPTIPAAWPCATASAVSPARRQPRGAPLTGNETPASGARGTAHLVSGRRA